VTQAPIEDDARCGYYPGKRMAESKACPKHDKADHCYLKTD